VGKTPTQLDPVEIYIFHVHELHVSATQSHFQATQDTHDEGSGTPSGAQRPQYKRQEEQTPHRTKFNNNNNNDVL
jgi:hypothetical protein